MKVIKAGFSKTFPLNQYYEKIWMEAELNDGDNERDCLYDLKRKVESFFFESKAAAEKQMGTHTQIVYGDISQPTTSAAAVNNTTQVKTQEQTIIEGINSCQELKVLQSYALIVKNNPQFKEVYENKLKQLQ